MRLALIGDIHCFRLSLRPWHLLGKRLLGQANLWFRRRYQFNPELFEHVLQRVQSIQPDMLLCTGDVTTTALHGEFEDVARALLPLANHVPTIIVPGNHDRYTFTSKRVLRMEQLLGTIMPQNFPELRRLTNRWHLLSLDSAVPRMFSSRGAVGIEQIRRARTGVVSLSADDCLMVLCHYPFAVPPGKTWRNSHQLQDAPALAQLLRDCPARVLFMHGHVHESWIWHPEDFKMGHITDVNAGSPTYVDVNHPYGQGFWQIDLPEQLGATINMIHHQPDEQGVWRAVAGQPL